MNTNNHQIHESWSEFYHYQKNIRSKYKSIWKIPLIKKVQNTVIPYVDNSSSILDVGAYDRRFNTLLRKNNCDFLYKSLDIDPKGNHDYKSFDEIEKKFSIALLFEVIEHITIIEAIDLLKNISNCLDPNGLLFISTPNIHHPSRYLYSPDHITPYRYDALGGILTALGYELEIIYRVYNDAFHRYWFRILLGQWLHRYLDVDFAHTIVAVGKRRRET